MCTISNQPPSFSSRPSLQVVSSSLLCLPFHIFRHITGRKKKKCFSRILSLYLVPFINYFRSTMKYLMSLFNFYITRYSRSLCAIETYIYIYNIYISRGKKSVYNNGHEMGKNESNQEPAGWFENEKKKKEKVFPSFFHFIEMVETLRISLPYPISSRTRPSQPKPKSRKKNYRKESLSFIWTFSWD